LNGVDSKYNHLFQLGEALPPMDPAMKNETSKVKGCQSELWFHLTVDKGKLTLNADSDSMVIKAIAALLARVVKDRSPVEIQNISLDFIDDLGIWKLPSERNNGLLAMLSHIKKQAKEMCKDIQLETIGRQA